MKEFKRRRRNNRGNVLKQKKLHGQFFNQIEEVAGEKIAMGQEYIKSNRITNYGSTRTGH